MSTVAYSEPLRVNIWQKGSDCDTITQLSVKLHYSSLPQINYDKEYNDE